MPDMTFSRTMRILLVDRDPASLALLAEQLRAKTSAEVFAIATAVSQEEALATVRESYVDMMLISTNNVVELGTTLISAVRSQDHNRHTGIIILDQRPMDDGTLSVECLELGADDFIRHGCSAEEVIARMKAVLRLKEMTDKLRTANHQLKILSRTDDLTGLENMRSFTRHYGTMLSATKSGNGKGLGVIMLDLDHFKSVNDSTNHLMGSFVLSEIGGLIRQSNIMADGASARYGGDEFVFAWHCDSLDAIMAKAEEIRKMIGFHTFERDGASLNLTASVGVAFVVKGFLGRADDVIKAADLMLYRSKNSGRNQVNGMILRYPVELERGAADELANRPAERKPASLTATLFMKAKG